VRSISCSRSCELRCISWCLQPPAAISTMVLRAFKSCARRLEMCAFDASLQIVFTISGHGVVEQSVFSFCSLNLVKLLALSTRRCCDCFG
jgi:uncharacterized caspase-like protein